MARLPRMDPEGPLHHAMNRGARGQLIFLDDTDRRMFVALLAVIHERFGVETQAYALMGNHYHLVLHCPEQNLSRAMQYLGSVYTQRFNRRHGFDGALFRGRFKSVPVTTDEYVLELTRYVHRNPRCLDPDGALEDYAWSSYAMYLGLRPKPGWLGEPMALSFLGQSIDRYRRYVEAQRPSDDKGGTRTDQGAARSAVRPAPSETQWQPALTDEPTLDMVEEASLSTTGTTLDQLLTDERDNVARELAAFLAAELTGATDELLAEWLCAASPDALAATIRSARKRTRDPAFAALLSVARHRLLRRTEHDNAS